MSLCGAQTPAPTARVPSRDVMFYFFGEKEPPESQVIDWTRAASDIFQSSTSVCADKRPCRISLNYKGLEKEFYNGHPTMEQLMRIYRDDVRSRLRYPSSTFVFIVVDQLSPDVQLTSAMGFTSRSGEWSAIIRPKRGENVGIILAHEYTHAAGISERVPKHPNAKISPNLEFIAPCALMNPYYGPTHRDLSARECAAALRTVPAGP